MIESILQQRGEVQFPEHTGERIYMLPFLQKQGLPKEFGRWQPTVDQMMSGIHTDLPVYLMVDQGTVGPDRSHRRPGVHVDGYWRAEGRHTGHRSTASSHMVDAGDWDGGGWGGEELAVGNWDVIDFSHPEAIILASDVSACAAYLGQYDEQRIGQGGDASKIILDSLNRVELGSNVVWAGNVGLLHESLVYPETVNRTLVRLSVPGWTPQIH
jgi:hypothetical protein